MVGAQLGSGIEVMALRETVDRQRRAATEVLGRLDREGINLVKECPACCRCFDRGAERCEHDGAVLELTLPVERVVDAKYRLDRLLGRGGMGAVYEAEDLRLGRRVAVKIVTGGFLGDGAALRRFAREAQASARLVHPHIVRVYDYGSLGGEAAYLVMERAPGITWRALLEARGTLPPAHASELIDQVLAGLEHAHATGVLHRDLKPENLLVADDGAGGERVRILDFGLAKLLEGSVIDPKSRTTSGVSMGTFGYMSPEQLFGREVDARTDVYAMGVIALETLTGAIPVRGEFFHFAIDAVVQERLVAQATDDAGRALAAAVAGALCQDADARTPTVTALRASLIPAIRAWRGPAPA